MITSTRGSLHVTDDKNSRDHMKKYSQRGDRMDVKSRTRKESFERKLQETSLIKHMITVLTDEKSI